LGPSGFCATAKGEAKGRKRKPTAKWNGLIFQWLGIKICLKPYFSHWISIEIEKSIKWKMSCIEIGEKN
jgi:hypothetical protein